MRKIKIYTDGACSGNPGPGGWAAILICNDLKKEIVGHADSTTNNVMELTAVIESLKILKEPCEIDVYSDSQYVVSGIQEWLPNWIKNNWKSSSNKPVKNQELWQEYLRVSQPHIVHLCKVQGHADDVYNNRCDELAVQQSKSVVVCDDNNKSNENYTEFLKNSYEKQIESLKPSIQKSLFKDIELELLGLEDLAMECPPELSNKICRRIDRIKTILQKNTQ